jgi:hypothetical protein
LNLDLKKRIFFIHSTRSTFLVLLGKILYCFLLCNFPLILCSSFFLCSKKAFDVLVLSRIGSAPPHLADPPIYSVYMCVSLSFL